MPTIKIIDSINVDVYARKHPPPHFYVLFAEYEELIVIKTLETYIRHVPMPQRKKVIKWAETQKELLLNNFKRLNPVL